MYSWLTSISSNFPWYLALSTLLSTNSTHLKLHYGDSEMTLCGRSHFKLASSISGEVVGLNRFNRDHVGEFCRSVPLSSQEIRRKFWNLLNYFLNNPPHWFGFVIQLDKSCVLYINGIQTNSFLAINNHSISWVNMTSEE